MLRRNLLCGAPKQLLYQRTAFHQPFLVFSQSSRPPSLEGSVSGKETLGSWSVLASPAGPNPTPRAQRRAPCAESGEKKPHQLPCAKKQQTRSVIICKGHRQSDRDLVLFAQRFILAVLRAENKALWELKFYSVSKTACGSRPGPATLTPAHHDSQQEESRSSSLSYSEPWNGTFFWKFRPLPLSYRSQWRRKLRINTVRPSRLMNLNATWTWHGVSFFGSKLHSFSESKSSVNPIPAFCSVSIRRSVFWGEIET